MGIYRLAEKAQNAFAEAPEIFASVQFAKLNAKHLLVLGCQVAVEFDEKIVSELSHFYDVTWQGRAELGSSDEGSSGIVERYQAWIRSLREIDNPEPSWVTRAELSLFVTQAFPPPPPNRPTLVPLYPPPPSLPQNFYGHLPFKAKTRSNEHYYRFEAWPTSRKITVGDPGLIGAQTYASPAAELRFLNTGFAAVARNALPSLFPAVFRYELQPRASHVFHCGAVIPNYGQSGGGVEVYFPSQIRNRGPIANPVVIPPL